MIIKKLEKKYFTIVQYTHLSLREVIIEKNAKKRMKNYGYKLGKSQLTHWRVVQFSRQTAVLARQFLSVCLSVHVLVLCPNE